MKTLKQIRSSFWENYPHFKSEYRTRKKQNEYSTDIRTSFCDYVDMLRKDGIITESKANKATL